MSQLTILESVAFWDELIKRSGDAEIGLEFIGKVGMKEILRTAFALKAEYDEKNKEANT